MNRWDRETYSAQTTSDSYAKTPVVYPPSPAGNADGFSRGHVGCRVWCG